MKLVRAKLMKLCSQETYLVVVCTGLEDMVSVVVVDAFET